MGLLEGDLYGDPYICNGVRVAALLRTAKQIECFAALPERSPVQIDFPYPGYDKIQPVDVPDEQLMGVFEPRSFEHIDEEKMLRHGFALPLGAPRLRDVAKGAKSVLLLIDDGTR